jgi:hypothetical protein
VGLKIKGATTLCGRRRFKPLPVNRFAKNCAEKLALPFASVKGNPEARPFLNDQWCQLKKVTISSTNVLVTKPTQNGDSDRDRRSLYPETVFRIDRELM